METADGDALKEEGRLLLKRGRRDEALARFEAAAGEYRRAGDVISEAEMHNNMAEILRLQRQWRAAQEALDKAKETFATAGDQLRLAIVLGNLGALHAATRRHEEAYRYYDEAARLFGRQGDHERRSEVLRAHSLLRLRRVQWLPAMQLMAASLQARERPSMPQRIFRLLLRFALRLLAG